MLRQAMNSLVKTIPDNPLVPDVQEEEEEIKEGDPRRLDEWERLEVEAEDVIIRNYRRSLPGMVPISKLDLLAWWCA